MILNSWYITVSEHIFANYTLYCFFNGLLTTRRYTVFNCCYLKVDVHF